MNDLTHKFNQQGFLNISVWMWVVARRPYETVTESLERYAMQFQIDVNDKSICALLNRYKRMQRQYLQIMRAENEKFELIQDPDKITGNDEIIKEIKKLKGLILQSQSKKTV